MGFGSSYIHNVRPMFELVVDLLNCLVFGMVMIYIHILLVGSFQNSWFAKT